VSGFALATPERDFVDAPSKFLTVFLPVYNEAKSISQILRDFHGRVVAPCRAKLLVCEDGSTDGSREVLERLARELPMGLVTGPGRKGYARAARDGLGLIDTPYVFFADSDGQYDPADFWKIWNARGTYDMVIGRKEQRQEKLYRTVLSRGFHLLVKAFTSVPLKDMDCGFRLIRREVVEAVLPEVRSLKYSFWAEFSIVAYRKGFRILEVPVSHRPSARGGTSIYSWNRMPRILLMQVLGLLRLAYRLNRRALDSGSAQSRTLTQTG
jgi:glycosyltransferase involved in cell wall biosynthesis